MARGSTCAPSTTRSWATGRRRSRDAGGVVRPGLASARRRPKNKRISHETAARHTNVALTRFAGLCHDGGDVSRTATAAQQPARPEPNRPGGAMATDSAARPARPALARSRQLEMYRRALRHLPGGTDSNFRAWGEDTIYVDRGQGGRVWDLDGNEFVDLRMGYGPVILGHGDPRVDDYVNERMRRGVSFSLTSEDEVKTAELICEMTFCYMARMTASGTEATMHAIRV